MTRALAAPPRPAGMKSCRFHWITLATAAVAALGTALVLALETPMQRVLPTAGALSLTTR